jgi:hypothetical protein
MCHIKKNIRGDRTSPLKKKGTSDGLVAFCEALMQGYYAKVCRFARLFLCLVTIALLRLRRVLSKTFSATAAATRGSMPAPHRPGPDDTSSDEEDVPCLKES